MAHKPHFGQWLKRIREKLGMTQRSLAAALGLDSHMTVHKMEKSAEPSVRGTTEEALLDVLGYDTRTALDEAWQSGTLPDLDKVRARLVEAQALAREGAGDVRFDAALVTEVFRWLAAHRRPQLKDLLLSVPKRDAAAVAQALVERVAEAQ